MRSSGDYDRLRDGHEINSLSQHHLLLRATSGDQNNWLGPGHPVNQTYHDLFIYLGFNVAFNTVQVISRRVVGRAEETST